MVWLGVAKKTLCMENYCNYEPFLASYEVSCSPNTRLCHKKKILDKQTLTHARIEIPVLVFFSSIYNKTNGFFTPFKIYSNTMPTKCFTIHFKLTLVKLISVSSRRSFFFQKDLQLYITLCLYRACKSFKNAPRGLLTRRLDHQLKLYR